MVVGSSPTFLTGKWSSLECSPALDAGDRGFESLFPDAVVVERQDVALPTLRPGFDSPSLHVSLVSTVASLASNQGVSVRIRHGTRGSSLMVERLSCKQLDEGSTPLGSTGF